MEKRRWLHLVAVVAVIGALVLGTVGGALAQTPAPAASPVAATAPTTDTVAAAPKTEFEMVAALVTERFKDWAPTVSADDLYENLNDGDTTNDPFIVSVRKPEDYAKGHIPGAVNIPWKSIAAPESLAALPKDRPIVTYCYTGHTGQVAATVLRLLGYDVVNLKYGMMGWTDDDTVLATPRFEGAAGYPVETTVNPLPAAGTLPELKTGMTTAEEIVAARANEFLAKVGRHRERGRRVRERERRRRDQRSVHPVRPHAGALRQGPRSGRRQRVLEAARRHDRSSLRCLSTSRS